MDPQVIMNTLWTVIAAILIFFMGLGFACIESGFTRAKNCVNILSKNFIVVLLQRFHFGFWFWTHVWRWQSNIWIKRHYVYGGADNSPASGDAYTGVYSALKWISIPLGGKFFFQMKFAMVAASIISGLLRSV